LNQQRIDDVEGEQPGWPEALATVIACKYDFGAGRALAFGIPTGKHFRISYNYFADGNLHTGEFTSAKAIPQGHLFPIRYNPNAPHQNSRSASTVGISRRPVLVVGIIGSIILSLLWFAVLRGCH
jgi:hypothetical protein